MNKENHCQQSEMLITDGENMWRCLWQVQLKCRGVLRLSKVYYWLFISLLLVDDEEMVASVLLLLQINLQLWKKKGWVTSLFCEILFMPPYIHTHTRIRSLCIVKCQRHKGHTNTHKTSWDLLNTQVTINYGEKLQYVMHFSN